MKKHIKTFLRILQMTQISNSNSRCVFLSIFSIASSYESNISSVVLYFLVPRDLLLPVRHRAVSSCILPHCSKNPDTGFR